VVFHQSQSTKAMRVVPSTKKSWAKAPELFFKPPPDGPIKLGNVIVDPACPEHPIAKLAPDLEPTILDGEPERHRTILREYNLKGEANAHICAYEMATAHVGVEKGKILLNEYSMDSLVATYYASKPSSEALKHLRSDEGVKDAVGRGWSQHVYIVCGVRVAKNFSLKESSAQDKAGDAGLGAEASEGLSVGSNARLSQLQKAQDAYSIKGDIVLAYQLIKVSRTPLGRVPEKAEKHYPRGAFLSDGQAPGHEQGEKGEGDIHLQVTSACEDDHDGESIDWLD
jgi:hypothetical protein